MNQRKEMNLSARTDAIEIVKEGERKGEVVVRREVK